MRNGQEDGVFPLPQARLTASISYSSVSSKTRPGGSRFQGSGFAGLAVDGACCPGKRVPKTFLPPLVVKIRRTDSWFIAVLSRSRYRFAIIHRRSATGLSSENRPVGLRTRSRSRRNANPPWIFIREMRAACRIPVA